MATLLQAVRSYCSASLPKAVELPTFSEYFPKDMTAVAGAVAGVASAVGGATLAASGIKELYNGNRLRGALSLITGVGCFYLSQQLFLGSGDRLIDIYKSTDNTRRLISLIAL